MILPVPVNFRIERVGSLQASQIPAFRQHEVKGLAVAINRPIQISPFALHLDIGLVNTPGTGRAALAQLSPSGNLRRVTNYHRFKVAWSPLMPHSAKIS